MSDHNISIFKNLTLLFLTLNAAFLYAIYISIFGMKPDLLVPTGIPVENGSEVLLYISAISVFLGLSYIFLLTKKYGISLTFAVMPQFAFIGALAALFL
tara:strand:- start:16805 stop:17101 length:297 start_codon:yes stop_codon:yes gene_type:complete